MIALTAGLVEELALGRVTPTYQRTASGPPLAGDSRGYGAYLGTVPDFRGMEDAEGGVLLADVRAGSPAARAGIRGGDRIVGLAGTQVENLYDMTYALQDHKPGDAVDVVVMRGRRAAHAARRARRARARPPARAARPAPAAARRRRGPAPDAARSPRREARHRSLLCRAARARLRDRRRPALRPRVAGERHLADVRQLTFGGENAEPYFSPDGRRIIFQATTTAGGCDQQYVMDLATGDVQPGLHRARAARPAATSTGPRATASSTPPPHGAGDACPAPPDQSQGYVWALYDSYDLYEAAPDGGVPRGGSPRRRATTPRRRGATAAASWCSPPCATATSTST